MPGTPLPFLTGPGSCRSHMHRVRAPKWMPGPSQWAQTGKFPGRFRGVFALVVRAFSARPFARTRAPIYYSPVSHVYIMKDQDPIHAALAEATFRALREAAITLPPDVIRAIDRAAACRDEPGGTR